MTLKKKHLKSLAKEWENSMRNCNVETIDNIIGIMAKRRTEVIKNRRLED